VRRKGKKWIYNLKLVTKKKKLFDVYGDIPRATGMQCFLLKRNLTERS